MVGKTTILNMNEQAENKHKEWGEVSGIKAEIHVRNNEIKEKFHMGMKIEELSSEYCLAIGTIKKIVYTRKNY